MAPAALFAYLFIFTVLLGAFASDPDMLQDICVAVPSSPSGTGGVKFNGFGCKTDATADDFFYTGLSVPGLTNNSVGSLITAANVEKIPGLNALGVSMSRIDYAPGGLNPPHTHPRASEVVFVLEGELEVGFITSANMLFSKIIKKGEIFVFPRGLIHFQKNTANTAAALIAAFNSQLPGTQSVAATLFAATPQLPDDVLTRAFHVGPKGLRRIRNKLTPKKK